SVSTDQIRGGRSTAEIKVIDGGAEASRGALSVTGTVDGGLPYAWAGALFSPGPQVMAPANLSGKKAIRFWARGDGNRYTVMVFVQSRPREVLTHVFSAEAQWKEYVIPLAAFGGIDGSDVRGILFGAGPEAGAFKFEIDEVTMQ